MLVFKVVVFALATVMIVHVSRSSLVRPRSHGFYRAFAWEAILILILLNLESWFREPFSGQQIVSWVLLTVSLLLVIPGALLLHGKGKPDSRREEVHLLGIEKTSVLVTSGPYRFIRHPVYGSLLALAWGAFFKRPSWTGALLAGVATGFLVATARVEETENVRYFGAAYSDYMKRTKMFIPFLF